MVMSHKWGVLVPFPQVQQVTHFQSRSHLIECLLASTHKPFFMDFKPWYRLNGMKAVDILRMFHSREALLSSGENVICVSAYEDEEFLNACKSNGWSWLKPDGAEEFIEYGMRYVDRQCASEASFRWQVVYTMNQKFFVHCTQAKYGRRDHCCRIFVGIGALSESHIRLTKYVGVLLVTRWLQPHCMCLRLYY